MALILEEPGIMCIARTPEGLKTQAISKHENFIDYRKLPRSSGDGMEHSGNHSEPSTRSPNSTPSHQVSKTIHKPTLVTTKNDVIQPQGKHQYISQSSDVNYGTQAQSISRQNTQPVNSLSEIQNHGKESGNDSRNERMGFKQESLPSLIDNRGKELVVNHSPRDSTMCHGDNYDILNFETTIDDTIIDGNENLTSDSGRTIPYEEFSKMQNVIKGLEDRYAKLVEDKTKLCVQLGLQSEVNAELKKLVVAAVGDDLENSLEALLMKNAQSAVEIKHWKTLSEEYAEESDKLAIECDVWRTKFLASRMMSDELSSWKTTLYTKFKQTQSALHRILNEREELKKYLIKTKRLLHTLNESIHKSAPENDNYHLGQQSVLELASLTSCLVQDLATKTLQDYQGNSVAAETFAVTEAEKQTVEPTAGEILAIQVLTSDVELHTNEQPEDSTIMKRLGKQYIGNSYQSRLTTNSFRVTYDCCDRCKGPVQVV